MKLTKLSNGNVLVSNTQGEVITSLVATTLVHRHPRHGQGVQLTSIANDQHTDKAFVIYNDNLTLEIEGVATKWTGTRTELIEKLSLEFFFSLAGATGGGLTTYDHYSDIPSDLKVGSQFVLLNASGVWPNRKKTGLYTKDSDGVRRLGAMSMVAANIIIQPHRWLNANDLQAGLIQIVNKVPSLTTVYNTDNPEWTAVLNQIGANNFFEEVSKKCFFPGMRVFWRGNKDSVPAGWKLVTDAEGRFIVGTGGIFSNGEKGGSTNNSKTIRVTVASHRLTENEIPSHSHQFEYTDTSRYSVKEKGVKGTFITYDSSTDGDVNSYNGGIDWAKQHYRHRTMSSGGNNGHSHVANGNLPSYYTAGYLIEFVGFN